MIFRTITDDITGANKSIGLFGKSLDNIKNILYSFQTNGIKNTLLNKPLANIDTKAIDRYNAAIQASVPFEKALDTARRTTNAETVSLIESTNGATVSTEALTVAQQSSTIAAKAHSATLKAVSIAGNMILFTAITKGIQLAVKAIDDYVHRVDRARERTEELLSEFQEMNNTLADHKKTVSELADRYDELSKGVNTIDNSNIFLSDEEYDEFLDINNQLVDIFPELYDGLGENGSAILNIGTSAQSASEYLQELIDKEEYLNNIKIASNLDELFKNVSVQVEDSNSKISQLEEELNSLDATWQNAELMNEGDILGLDMLEIGDNPELINAVSRSIQQLQDEVYAQFKDNKLDTDEYLNFVDNFVNPALYNGATIFDGYVNLIALDDKQKQRLQNIIQEQTESLMNELNDSVSTATGKIALEKQNNDAIWADFIPSFVAAMKSKANFQQLDDVGLGDFAVSLVEQLDYSIIQELKGTAYENDIYGYVRDKILVPIQNAIKDESGEINVDDLEKIKNQISDALDMKDSFNKNDSSVADYVGQVNDLISTLELLGMSPDIIKYVKVVFDYDEAEKLRNRLSNGGQDLVVDDWIDTLTQEEVKLANSTSFDEALERQKQGLDGAALSAENYSAALDEVKNGQDGLGHETGNLSFNTENFSSVVDALSSVQSLYSDFKEKADEGIDFTVDFSDIEGLRETFTKLGVPTEQFDEFENVLSSSSSTAEQAQGVFNSMAASLIYSTGCLDGLNTSNRDLIVSQLELQGIINASSVVTEDLAMASEVLAQNGYSLADASETAYWSILNEAGASEVTKAALYALNAAEIAYSNNGFSTQEKINQLGDLAKKYGDTATAAIAAAAADRVAAGHGDYESVLADMMAQVNRATQNIHIELPEVDASKAKGSASKAGKDVGKSYKDGLKEELSDLDSVISGITSRIDDQISSVNEQKEAALESIDAQKEALEEAKDAAVEALEAERDARLEVIETQKAQLEEQIKLIDKQIKSKQDEIDRINKAAEARAREISLQEKQYALEQKRNQRTKLVYTESSGMIYRPDEQGIRKAKEEVDEAKRQIEIANIQKEIDLLEDQKDLLNEQITLLDEQADAVNKYYDEQIKQTEKFYDQQIKNLEKQRKETEAYYDSLTKSLEQRKEKFQELTEILEKAELSEKLKQLGIDEEALLNGSEEEFEKLKNAYMNIVNQLMDGNDKVLDNLGQLSNYNGTAPAMLDDSNTKLGTMNDELGNANTEVGKVNTSLGNTASTTGKVSDNIGDLSDKTTGLGDSLQEVNSALKNIPDSSSKIGDIAKSYGELATSLQSKEGSELDTQIGNINDSLSKIPEANSKIDPIVTSYKDLKDSLTGEDGASTNDKLEDINDVLDEIPNVSQSVTDIAEAYEKLSGSLTSEENVGLGKELSEINKELDVVPEPTNVTETALAYEKLDKAVVGNSDAKISGEIGNINTALGETPEPTNINNVTNAINELSVSIDKSKQSMDALSEAELNVNNNANDIAISIQSIVDNIQSAYENVETLRDGLSETNTFVVEEQIAFDILRQKIDEVVEVITEKISATYDSKSATETSISAELEYYILLKEKLLEVKESLDSINEAISLIDVIPINNLTSAFQLLYDKLLLVSNLLGVGMEGAEEGAVSGISGAIQALNEISLEEGIIAQFTMLKEAIDSVTAAISGGGGESSEGEGSGGGSGSKGGQSGGKGGKGSQGKGESGGGNSLTGAIKEMGDTAQEVIGEPDAEGDGTVIGEFGSMETAVNDVRDAIGTEGSEGSEGGNSGGETDDTLVGSIEYLGDKTEEEMGAYGGDGIIGRFEEFRDVIGQADEHVKSISEGLDEIDGKEVSCTIHVNIETSGGTGFTGSAQVLGSMNLDSATYNAQYKGNAHYEGTAEVTGDWGVKKGGTTLVGELGQELVVFPNGRFRTVGDNGAEFVDIPANSIVFNHLQTRELLSKGNIVGRGRALASGTALANGTTNKADDSIWTTLADGTRVRELQPGDRMYDMMQKFDAYFNSMDGNIEKLVPNSVYEHQRQMEDMAKQINYVSSVVNNNRNVQQPVTIQVGDINLTGVQDVNGLAHAITTRLPNAMLQEMHRR